MRDVTRLRTAALVCSLALAAAVGAQSQTRTQLFPPQELGLLEAPDREQWQKPDLIMDALLIAEGSVVADLGAGGGWFTAQLSARVGPNGIVYAEDIQPAMIDTIERRKVRENRKRPSDPHANIRASLRTTRR
jgi:predicted methyltransferase